MIETALSSPGQGMERCATVATFKKVHTMTVTVTITHGSQPDQGGTTREFAVEATAVAAAP